MAKPKAAAGAKSTGIPPALRDALWAAVEALPLKVRDGEDRNRVIAQIVAAIDAAHQAAWTSEPNPSEQADAGERLQILFEAARDLRLAFPGRDVTAWEALQELEPARLDVWYEPSGKKDHLALLVEAAAVQERFSDRWMSPTFIVKPGDELAAKKRIERMRRRTVPSAAGYLALAVQALARVDLDQLEAAAAKLKRTARTRGAPEVSKRQVNFALRLAEIFAESTGRAPALGIRGDRKEGGPYPRFVATVCAAFGRPFRMASVKNAVDLYRKKHNKA